MHVVDRLLAFLDGELSPEDRAAVAQHLDACPSCREELGILRLGHEQMSSLPPASLPADFADRVVARTRLGSAWDRTWLGLHPRLALAAALVLLAATAALGVLGGMAIAGRTGAGQAEAPPTAATTVRVADASEPQFLLLLLQSEHTDSAALAEQIPAYEDWAMGLVASGRLVTAQKLMDENGRWVLPTDPGFDPAVMEATSMQIGGFFLIRASGYEEAVQIARESPHVRFGGTILVRQVDLQH